jgi:hypothetical protein
MSRLTDEELADVAHRVSNGKCHNCAGTGNEQPWRSCRVCDGTGVFALSTQTMESVLLEVIERRAADLKPDEVKDLMWARDEIRMLATQGLHPDWMNRAGRALSILDRLAGSKP